MINGLVFVKILGMYTFCLTLKKWVILLPNERLFFKALKCLNPNRLIFGVHGSHNGGFGFGWHFSLKNKTSLINYVPKCVLVMGTLISALILKPLLIFTRVQLFQTSFIFSIVLLISFHSMILFSLFPWHSRCSQRDVVSTQYDNHAPIIQHYAND